MVDEYFLPNYLVRLPTQYDPVPFQSGVDELTTGLLPLSPQRFERPFHNDINTCLRCEAIDRLRRNSCV